MGVRKYYLENQKFGKLNVVEYLGNSKYKCQCDCGESTIVTCSDLLKEKTKSCGCIKKSKQLDLVGKRFGNLLVVERVGLNENKHYLFKVKCDCGNEKNVVGKELNKGKMNSCGCGIVKGVKEVNTVHGMTNTRIYSIWNKMKSRCYNKNNPNYNNYGGRGILICDEWKGKHSFLNFYNWAINNGYKENLSIDRIDVNGNYEPSNCRWVSMKVQGNNKRNNVNYYYKGEYKTLSEICEINNLHYQAVWKRIHRYNWSLEKALNEPINEYTTS